MRVSAFLELDHYALDRWEQADSEIQLWAKRLSITVTTEVNCNHCTITFTCHDSLSLELQVRDLHQEQSPLIAAIEQTFYTDTYHPKFDFWNKMPCFGIAELYSLRISGHEQFSPAQLKEAFYILQLFMKNHFMMLTFRASENMGGSHFVEPIFQYAETYSYDEETYQRTHPAGYFG